MASVAKRTWTYNGQEKTAWIVRYKDKGGAHRQKTFELKKQADAYKRRVEDELERGSHIAATASPTVKTLADEYLADAAVRLKEGRRMGRGHFEQMERYFAAQIVPRVGNIRPCDLSYKDVQDLFRDLSAEPTISAETARRILYIFSGAMELAVRREYANRNVISLVLRDLAGVPKKRIRTFSPDEVRRILTAAGERQYGCAERTHALCQCVVHLGALCGLRAGEIFGLSWEAIDFDRNTLEVTHSLTAWDELKCPKTKSGLREVPLPVSVAHMLKAWRAHYVDNPRNLLFRLKSGRQMGAQNWHLNYWKPLLERCGFSPPEAQAPPGDNRRVGRFHKGDWPHFHALRHFYASALVQGGVPITDVASLLGHATFDTTLQVYAHPTMGRRRRQDAIGGIVAGVLSGSPCASVAHGPTTV